MADVIETYAATLQEVRRQAAQLRRSRSSSGGGSGSGDASESPASDATATISSAGSGSGSGSGWVVLESATTPAALPTEAGCSVWPQQQWQVAYELLFCQCPPAVARLQPHASDDLLFFAYSDEAAAAARTPLFVRRRQARAAALPPDLAAPLAGPTGAAAGGGAAAALVDWRASVLLMLVLQTGYRLSVVTAADPELLSTELEQPGTSGSRGARTGSASSSVGGAGGGSGGSGPGGVWRVTKTVHASPSHVPVNLDQSRSDAGRPQVSYPDLCFAVDSCDEAFQSQVLHQPHDAYCVLLHADVAQSWTLPAAQAAAAAAAGNTSAGSDAGGGQSVPASAAAAEAVSAGLAGLSLSEQQQQASSSDGGGMQRGAGASGSKGSVGSAGSAAASRPRVAAAAAAAAAPPLPACVFSGFVSHAQLTAALGSQLAGDPVRQVLRAAAAAARGSAAQRGEAPPLATCRVVMRGPGGRGAADVAVSSLAPSPDEGHLPVASGRAAGGSAGGVAEGAAAQSSTGGAPSASAAAVPSSSQPKLFERAQLLARGVAAAAKAAAAGPRGGGGGAGGLPVEQLHLRCALMALQLPVDMLAEAILEAL